MIAIVAIIFAVIIVVSGVVLFGYKGIQRRHAVGLLMQSGLSEIEAKARIQSIARGTKLPAFANAYQMAGITDGSVIMSADQMQTEAEAQEFAATYGSDSQQDPNTGFMPSPAVRQVDPAIAEAALAAFADEPAEPQLLHPHLYLEESRVECVFAAIC